MTLRHTFVPTALLLSLPVLDADAQRNGPSRNPAPWPVNGSASATATAGETDATRVAIQRAVDAVYPALVRIHVVSEEGGQGRMQKHRASGSGAIIDEEGHVVTNHHVAGRATRITCRLSNREEVDATLVGTDPLTDIAVLKLDLSSRRQPAEKLVPARFGDSDELAVGDVVLAMGSPAGVSQSVTRGIVSNTAMISPGGMSAFTLDGEKVGELVRWIGHDAVIYPGNSGGPLVNLKGEIIGVNEVGIGSLGGAIPAKVARLVAREIIARGNVARSWIGLEVQPLLKTSSDANGVLVGNVLPDSPALEAGIRAGDVISSVNGDEVPASRAAEDIPLFNRMVLTAPVGRPLTLKGSRDGKSVTWKLTSVGREPNEARESEMPQWGLTVRNFTRISALENQRKNKQGVLVDSVRPGGPCTESKPALRNDDVITKVNGRVIRNVEDLTQFTYEFTNGLVEPKALLVTFDRASQELVTVARIGPEPQEDKPARPDRAWMGLQTQVLTPELAEAFDVAGKKGVRATFVMPDSPAAKAGLQAGDILLKMDGQVIAASTPGDEELFANLIRQYKVNSDAELEGMRNGQPLKVSVKLGKQPKPNSELDEYKDERFEFTARDMSLMDRVTEKLADSDKGVRIGTVETSGWAALAGLSSGDILMAVDGQAVETIGDLKKTMTRVQETKPRRTVFFIKRGIRTQFIELEPKW